MPAQNEKVVRVKIQNDSSLDLDLPTMQLRIEVEVDGRFVSTTRETIPLPDIEEIADEPIDRESKLTKPDHKAVLDELDRT
jgi:hypothetical protein